MNHATSFLADIGNTHIHLFDGKEILHLPHKEAIEKYAQYSIDYITVNQALEEQIIQKTNWHNVSSSITLKGAYDTMGVDRKALCLSRDNGIFVDAGSAITVDVMRDGVYIGGFILPGIQAQLRSYASISPVLETTLDETICLDALPCTTKEGISYGIIASIKAVIAMHQESKMIYFTGGDGAFLSSLFEGSVFDETLVFQGMRKALEKCENYHKQG
jgi:type III pantothenate kinase